MLTPETAERSSAERQSPTPAVGGNSGRVFQRREIKMGEGPLSGGGRERSRGRWNLQRFLFQSGFLG